MEAVRWGETFDSWGATVNKEDQESLFFLPKWYLKCQARAQEPVFTCVLGSDVK